MNRLLLCTDLDRTLLPNGSAPESAGAREVFARLVVPPEVKLVYVTGRDPGLVGEAITTWEMPEPDLLIADVGTTIADRGGRPLGKLDALGRTIAGDWAGRSTEDLQGTSERSCRPDPAGCLPPDRIQAELFHSRRSRGVGHRPGNAGAAGGSRGQGQRDLERGRCHRKGLAGRPAGVGHQAAGHRVCHGALGLRAREVVFAGDSGNDLDVLASPIPAVLVANATDESAREAREAQAKANGHCLYCARGGALGMNGNYAAGILEGVLHFHPAWTAMVGGHEQ